MFDCELRPTSIVRLVVNKNTSIHKIRNYSHTTTAESSALAWGHAGELGQIPIWDASVLRANREISHVYTDAQPQHVLGILILTYPL